MSFFVGLFLGALFCGLFAAAFIIKQRNRTEVEEWTREFYDPAAAAPQPRAVTRVVNRERIIEL